MFRSIIIAFSMYSRIPMPHISWEDEDMRYMFVFFPFVGAVIAGVEYLCRMAGVKLGLEPVFVAAVMTVIPLIITGGIHLDGYMDTSDALSSYRSREERLRILKDAHIGAFAVIKTINLMLLCFGAVHQIMVNGGEKGFLISALGLVLSRVMSGLSVMLTDSAGNGGTLEKFSNAADKRVIFMLAVEYVLTAAGMIYISPVYGVAAIAAAAVWFFIYRHICMRSFGGVTGDTSGWFLCITECLCALTTAILSAPLLHP
ncbi:MAG TPA: adenosylcobinamide-GDP ribazoletransferase [Lachnospiraceae bacterium]|nr:adenosylcobinamide-GDP ribazoletransferase [Lachnospiraceae bacterium]